MVRDRDQRHPLWPSFSVQFLISASVNEPYHTHYGTSIPKPKDPFRPSESEKDQWKCWLCKLCKTVQVWVGLKGRFTLRFNNWFGTSVSTLASYLINWGCNPFSERFAWFRKKSKQFNQSSVATDMTALTLTLTFSVNRHLTLICMQQRHELHRALFCRWIGSQGSAAGQFSTLPQQPAAQARTRRTKHFIQPKRQGARGGTASHRHHVK